MVYKSVHERNSFTDLIPLISVLSIKDDEPRVLSLEDTSDDVMSTKYGDWKSMNAQSNRKALPRKRTCHKSIQKQQNKRLATGSLKQPEVSNHHKNYSRYSEKSMSQKHKPISHGSGDEGHNSKGQDVSSCPTWRQLTLQSSGTENGSRASATTCRHKSKFGPIEEDCLAKDESSYEDVIPDCPERNINDRKTSSRGTDSHHESGDHNNQTLDINQCEVKKTSYISSNETHPSVSKYPGVRQPTVVLIDCLTTFEIDLQPSTVKTSKTSPLKSKGWKLNKSSQKTDKSRSESDYDEFCFEDSQDEGQPTKTRLGETKSTFHVTKRQSSSLGGLNHSPAFGSSNPSKRSKDDSGPVSKSGVRRKVRELDEKNTPIIPTWRQLTKLQSSSSEHQNTSKSLESGSDSTNYIEYKIKRKRQISEGTLVRKRITKESGNIRLLQQSGGYPSKPRLISPTEKCSSTNTSPKFRLKNQKSPGMMLPTWRQLSVMQADHSKPHQKSLEDNQKPKKSTADQDAKDSTSVMPEMLPEAKPIIVTFANLKLPTIRISLLNSHDVSLRRYMKPKTSAADENSNSSILAMRERPPKTNKMATTTANFKVPTTQASHGPESSAPSRRSTSNEPNTKSAQGEILKHKTVPAAKPESKPSASSEPFPKAMPDVTEEKPHYECTMCDYRGSHLGMIWNHILDHKSQDNGVKPYACDECDYRTKTDQLLRTHKITHAGEKPYPCDLCDRRCRSKTHLRIHKILRHKEKPFSCHGCDFKCADERLFQAHSRIHTDSQKTSSTPRL